MKTLQITYDEAVADLKAIVAGREDFVYEAPEMGPNGGAHSCAYFDRDGVPSCIIGHLLSRHGIYAEDLVFGQDVEDEHLLDAYDEDGNPTVNTGHGVVAIAGIGMISTDYDTIGFLESVQDKQDFGTPWGLALALALDEDRGTP